MAQRTLRGYRCFMGQRCGERAVRTLAAGVWTG